MSTVFLGTFFDTITHSIWSHLKTTVTKGMFVYGLNETSFNLLSYMDSVVEIVMCSECQEQFNGRGLAIANFVGSCLVSKSLLCLPKHIWERGFIHVLFLSFHTQDK